MNPTEPNASPPAVRWLGGTDGRLILLDQTRLPLEVEFVEIADVNSLWHSIRQLQVRGAPAIGIAAAYGFCLAAQTLSEKQSAERWIEELSTASDHLASSRPTAVNLSWALTRMMAHARARTTESEISLDHLQTSLLNEAHSIREEDRIMCHAIGRHGASLLGDSIGVLTHCNTGGLATAEYGTALSVLLTAHDQAKSIHVYVDETRPLLQGARLTTWELQQHGVPHTLICDSMAAQVMREGKVSAVITGADRIAANGDTANKIGTYGLAVLARAHQIPFYIAAPSSTFDWSLASGDEIPIEQRSSEEITCGLGRRTAPEHVNVYNPAFDVTPANLITALITEQGVIQPVEHQTIADTLRPTTDNSRSI